MNRIHTHTHTRTNSIAGNIARSAVFVSPIEQQKFEVGLCRVLWICEVNKQQILVLTYMEIGLKYLKLDLSENLPLLHA